MLTNGKLRFTFSRLQLFAAAAYAGFFVLATKFTTAANAIWLQYTAPVWIAIFAVWFLGERTRRRDWLIIVIVFVGMGLFFADGLELTGLLGNTFGILSGVCFAAMTISLRKQKDGSPVESIILGNLIAFVVGAPFMFGVPLPSPTGLIALAGPRPHQARLFLLALRAGDSSYHGVGSGYHPRLRANSQSRVGLHRGGRTAHQVGSGRWLDRDQRGDVARDQLTPIRWIGLKAPAALPV